MLEYSRKKFQDELDDFMSFVVASTVNLDTLDDEEALETLRKCGRLMNSYMEYQKDQTALLTNINKKLDEVLENQKKGS